jgi:hypothetical protein
MNDLFVFEVDDARSASLGLPAGQYLVTVFPTGGSELAYRKERHHTWGPPAKGVKR